MIVESTPPVSRRPAVDVLIPVHNGAETIEGSLASIQAQSTRDIRILVLNDGSTDATAAIVRRLAAADSRLTLIDKPRGGIVDTLNDGLALCTAEFIARHDADDLAMPDRFEKQLSHLRRHGDCAAVSGAARHIDGSGQTLGPVYHLPSPDLSDWNAYPQREPYLMHPFLMMRRAAVEQVGGYRDVFYAEDTDLYWRLQEIGTLCNLPDLLGEYRVHQDSVTGASFLNGKISAVNSQRAGLSAKRRREGRPDLAFSKEALAEYRAAGSMARIVEVGSRDLDATEAERLGVAACAKLLELASYRPYELQIEDCPFIRDTIEAGLPRMTAANRAGCIRMLSGSAARLASRGQVGAAMRLAPRRFYASAVARFALRMSAPYTLRRQLRRAVGRDGFIK